MSSFYTSLSGLNAAQTDLNISSNNIANAGTTGFKQSRADFGDLISSSAYQASNTVIGQGTQLKAISQEFSQGSAQSTDNALDLMVTGDGYFVTKASGTGSQVSFTRDGAFSVDNNNNVVDAEGNALQVLPVDSQGNVAASGAAAMGSLHVPATNGSAKATSNIDLSLTFPSDADLPASRSAYSGSTYAFSANDANSYNSATSTTIYDSAGTAIPATVYYVRDSAPAADGSSTTSTWTAHMMVGDQEVFPTGTTTPATLTFDANGALTSPSSAISYASVTPAGAVAPLTLSVDYGTATKQGDYAFSTTASSQDGATTGKLDNLSVNANGVVSASYSDGSTLALGAVALATFANPQGLHQDGNTSWSATAASGAAQIGAANSDGKGSIGEGELEMSNVDLTSELVNLIQAQRNFQANAKAIDTDKQMVESIINLQ
ncbi:MAG TPA: flagellar hook protein FlgE [Sphingomonas sp.]